MKYLVIEIQKFEGGSMSTPSYAFDNLNSAEAKWHTILASAAVSKLPVHSAVLLNETGYCIASKSYSHEEDPEEVSAE